MSWIPNYLDDLDADFRVFYRIDGIADGEFGGLSARRFVALAERTIYYSGSVATRARIEYEQQQGQQDDGFELPGGGDEQDGEPETDPAVDLRLGMETL